MNTDGTTDGTATIGSRAKDIVVLVVPVGKRAGTAAVQGVRQGVQGATVWAAPRLEDAIYSMRTWTAPRLDYAADAVDAAVAPRVSSALRATARQLRPDEVASGRTGFGRLLDWRLLVGVGAVAAAAGATAAAAVRRRYANATAEAKDATESSDEERAREDESASDVARSEVNGRVTTPER